MAYQLFNGECSGGDLNALPIDHFFAFLFRFGFHLYNGSVVVDFEFLDIPVNSVVYHSRASIIDFTFPYTAEGIAFAFVIFKHVFPTLAVVCAVALTRHGIHGRIIPLISIFHDARPIAIQFGELGSNGVFATLRDDLLAYSIRKQKLAVVIQW